MFTFGIHFGMPFPGIDFGWIWDDFGLILDGIWTKVRRYLDDFLNDLSYTFQPKAGRLNPCGARRGSRFAGSILSQGRIGNVITFYPSKKHFNLRHYCDYKMLEIADKDNK